MSGIFNVKNYGAKGDGTHDDKTAIQAAVDAANAAGGGTVYLPTGTYAVSGNSNPAHGSVRLRDNVTMQGDGMGSTTVKLIDGWSSKVTGIIRTFSGVVNHDITLRDLTIDGNKAKTPGAETDGFFTGVTPGKALADNNITVERVEIKNVSRYGFDPHEQTTGLIIRNSVAHHNGQDGFTIDFQSHGILENNVSYANGRHGFNLVTSTHDMVLKNNVAYDNAGNGLVVQRGSDNRPLTDNISVDGGKFYHNGLEGVLIKISTDVTLRGAEIYDNGKEGVEIAGSSGAVIADNLIYNNSRSDPGGYDEVLFQGYDDTSGPSGKFFAATNNTLANNIIYSLTGADHPVLEQGASSSGNVVSGNIVFGEFAHGISVVNALVSGVLGGLNAADYALTYLANGTDGADTITGTAASDFLGGGKSNDRLDGVDGNDVLFGGDGSDTLIGGIGKDLIIAGAGNDNISGGDGNDRLYGSAGDDTMGGGTNEDALTGGIGNDTLRGDAGNDSIAGGAGKDKLYGGAGLDVFVFERGGGYDTLPDFKQGEDLLDVHAYGFSGISAMQFVQSGVHVRIDLGGGDYILAGYTTVAEFSAADFVL